jgi:hypothetical protein
MSTPARSLLNRICAQLTAAERDWLLSALRYCNELASGRATRPQDWRTGKPEVAAAKGVRVRFADIRRYYFWQDGTDAQDAETPWFADAETRDYARFIRAGGLVGERVASEADSVRTIKNLCACMKAAKEQRRWKGYLKRRDERTKEAMGV